MQIQLGDRVLKDRFLWDPSEPRNSPEDFARAMALDLGLSGTLVPILAHAIREQLLFDRKVGAGAASVDSKSVHGPRIARAITCPTTQCCRALRQAYMHNRR